MTITFREMTDAECARYTDMTPEVWEKFPVLYATLPGRDDVEVWATKVADIGIVVDGMDAMSKWGVWYVAEGSDDLAEVLAQWLKDCEVNFKDES